MASPIDDKMSPAERRAGASLAAIFALRMLGLFLILPVFAVHAHGMPGGDNVALVGMAIGAYGLTQAFLQIPFGAASDRFGRKPVIVFGLLLFIIGSAVAAMAADVQTVVIGRVLQGAGAISAAVTALAADLTRDQHRTKVMAMIGSSIGLVFALSMVGIFLNRKNIIVLLMAVELMLLAINMTKDPRYLALSFNPANGARIGRVPHMGAAETQHAIAAATAAWPTSPAAASVIAVIPAFAIAAFVGFAFIPAAMPAVVTVVPVFMPVVPIAPTAAVPVIAVIIAIANL